MKAAVGVNLTGPADQLQLDLGVSHPSMGLPSVIALLEQRYRPRKQVMLAELGNENGC